ncbi:MAG: hypothetical protein U0V64_14890 [Cyclobacteriaceae bacterium]
MKENIIKLFLRLALAASFLSAVADRFGWWGAQYTVWGTWDKFIDYTRLINPWLPDSVVGVAGGVATALRCCLRAVRWWASKPNAWPG